LEFVELKFFEKDKAVLLQFTSRCFCITAHVLFSNIFSGTKQEAMDIGDQYCKDMV